MPAGLAADPLDPGARLPAVRDEQISKQLCMSVELGKSVSRASSPAGDARKLLNSIFLGTSLKYLASWKDKIQSIVEPGTAELIQTWNYLGCCSSGAP